MLSDSGKGLAVDGAGAVFLDSLFMAFDRVAFMRLKAVFRPALSIINHKAVSFRLGYDACGHNRRRPPVAFDKSRLQKPRRQIFEDKQPVNQDARRSQTRLGAFGFGVIGSGVSGSKVFGF